MIVTKSIHSKHQSEESVFLVGAARIAHFSRMLEAFPSRRMPPQRQLLGINDISVNVLRIFFGRSPNAIFCLLWSSRHCNHPCFYHPLSLRQPRLLCLRGHINLPWSTILGVDWSKFTSFSSDGEWSTSCDVLYFAPFSFLRGLRIAGCGKEAPSPTL